MTGNESGRRHTRDDVAETALRILDDYGLPDLTMRRLAAALDVQPSALYWHFPNKQTLLAELADRIVARGAGAPTDTTAWPDRLRAESVALRDALLAYRDGAEVVASTYALGLGDSAAQRRLAAAAASGGFDAETSDRAATALLHFVLGHVSHEQQRMQFDSIGVLATGEAADPLDASDSAAAFAFGVDLLVGGLERLGDESRSGPLSRSRT
ncbi:TetR/AcrR family transcriptional regulator C-terminal domain-containing protein [Leifsonia shinshuensis]|uniref:TetR/AcrR family transcriptional regulator C-terminal domain-containing protein n=1 Tax=Leifsonia shinshuensis TaxID=150026 RepID=UPI001F514DC6|nr:TetR/AcrR family transcriptional regulator C-terminal domain-containing protein [Leifsonia shinshuensis]MCI0159025.1 TetR/AcrR family transcriptional regulator C-terminal domain-containing protein [Leifsonia shinshuensis]